MVKVARLDGGVGLTKGDKVPIYRTFTSLRGATLDKIKLLVKENLVDVDASAKIAKVLTTSSTSDGQITDNGANNGIAKVVFILGITDTAGAAITADQDYFYDIQCHYSDGYIVTEESGRQAWREEVTLDNT